MRAARLRGCEAALGRLQGHGLAHGCAAARAGSAGQCRAGQHGAAARHRGLAAVARCLQPRGGAGPPGGPRPVARPHRFAAAGRCGHAGAGGLRPGPGCRRRHRQAGAHGRRTGAAAGARGARRVRLARRDRQAREGHRGHLGPRRGGCFAARHPGLAKPPATADAARQLLRQLLHRWGCGGAAGGGRRRRRERGHAHWALRDRQALAAQRGTEATGCGT